MKIYFSKSSYQQAKKAVLQLSTLPIGEMFKPYDDECAIDIPTREDSEKIFLSAMKSHFNNLTANIYQRLREYVRELDGICPSSENEQYIIRQYENGNYNELVDGVVVTKSHGGKYDLNKLHNENMFAKNSLQLRSNCQQVLNKIKSEHLKNPILTTLDNYLPIICERVGDYPVFPNREHTFINLDNEVKARMYRGEEITKTVTDGKVYHKDIDYADAERRVRQTTTDFTRVFVWHRIYRAHWFLRGVDNSITTPHEFEATTPPIDKALRNRFFHQRTTNVKTAITNYLRELDKVWRQSLYYKKAVR